MPPIRFEERRRVTESELKQIKYLSEQVTQTVGWYAHSKEVRGPYFRWFICQPGDDQGTGNLAELSDDTAYCAMAMNVIPSLLCEIESLKEELRKTDSFIQRKLGIPL